MAAFPRMRVAGAAFLAVWVPSYLHHYGPANFLNLCDVAVILTCVGLWVGSPLLLSSQAVSSLVVDTVWTVDVAVALVSGHHVVGGTEYMWDARFPLWLRLLSLFHALWPPLLVWAVRRVGYDRRALAFQTAVAAVVLVASWFVLPEYNLNFSRRDPFLHRSWGPAPVHLALTLLGLMLLVYWPTHALLARLFPRPGLRSARGASPPAAGAGSPS